MRKRELMKKSLAAVLVFALTGTAVFSGLVGKTLIAKAAGTTLGKASLADTVVGEYSWDTGSASNASLLAKLPTMANKGVHRFTTDNYDSSNGAFDTSDWGTSMMWSLNGGNAYGNSTYAIPWAFKASSSKHGMMITKPATTYVQGANEVGDCMMSMPEDGSMSEFVIRPGYTTNGLKVDKVTDWTYEVVMQNAADNSQYMKTTMVQGSPFAYFEMVGTNTMNIERMRGLPASVVSYDGTSVEDSTMLVVRVYDNHDETRTGNKYDYYAFYVPEGTVWDVITSGEMITSMTAEFPNGKSYCTVAVLTEQPNVNDTAAAEIANLFKPYAYNFVTDTKAEYQYDDTMHKVSTIYTYTVDKKAESTAEGTIMGILPHQYKNMSETNYLTPTFRTIRGTMKLLAGSSFQTELTFTGILPWLTAVDDVDALGGYVNEYMEQYYPGGVADDPFYIDDGSVDTYWTGKALNRTGNVLAAAEAAGDDAAASILLNTMQNELEDWFTATGDANDKYFYYDNDIGSLFGFPQSFYSVDQVNDHHFHYGYFIYAAAQVALRNPEWASDENYGLMVKEMIKDIACTERNNPDSKYPYLRNFAPYEGHSWASGHSNFADGNNHESSSEAINAWAGIIMFAEAIGDTELRDLGIYLYTTEISAINNYWFDVDEDVLDDNYRYYGQTNVTADSTPTYNQASMVWGGKYSYATWWTAEPLQVQGINLLPINPASFYLSENKDYIIENWEIALDRESRITADRMGDTYEEYTDRWNDVWSAYLALADPDTAIPYWDTSAAVENGESRAHTYHYIYSLKKAGKPDLTVTSNSTLSTCFMNSAGEKTYAVYNQRDTETTVTFSDGKTVVVQPKTMVTLGAGEVQGDSTYTVTYYKEKLDKSGYEKIQSVKKMADANTLVTITAKSFNGLTFDEGNENNILSGTILSDGSLDLQLYYKRNSYTINYELNGGTISAINPSSYTYGETHTLASPKKNGFAFDGWYTSSEFTTKVTSISATQSGNLTLYAKWYDPSYTQIDENKFISCIGTTLKFTVSGELDADIVTAYYKMCDTQSEALAFTQQTSVVGTIGMNLTKEDNGWSASVDVTGQTGKYCVVLYSTITGGIGQNSSWGVYQIPSGTIEGISYTTEYYLENLNGEGYTLKEIVPKAGEENQEVTAVETAFTGFMLDKSVNGTNASGIVAADSSLVLKLYYKRITYTIDYELKGGTNAVGNPESYRYGSTVSLAAAQMEGLTFGGWYTDEGLNNRITEITATAKGNLTLYAKWLTPGSEEPKRTGRGVEYRDGKITLYVADATEGVREVKVAFQTYATEAEAIERSQQANVAGIPAYMLTYDRESECWLYEMDYNLSDSAYVLYTFYFAGGLEEGLGPWQVASAAAIRGDAKEANYKINYYQQNITQTGYELVYADSSTIKATIGEEVTVPEKTYTGFTKKAFASTESGTVTADGSLILEIFYDRNTYVITYAGIEEITNTAELPAEYLYGAGQTLVEPVKAGYTFEGWYTESDFQNRVTTVAADAYGTLTLYAKLTKINVKEANYTVEFYQQNIEKNSYTRIEEDTIIRTAEIGTQVTAPNKSYNGFTMNTEESILSGEVNADGTMVLRVYYTRDTYAIYYEGISGISNESKLPKEYLYGVGQTLVAPVKAGYTFEGWYTEITNQREVKQITETNYGEIRLYAKFEKTSGGGTPGEEISGGETTVVYKANYKINYYQQNITQNGYDLVTEDMLSCEADIQSDVTAPEKSYPGFTRNDSISTMSGKVNADGSLVLCVYYDRNEYAIRYVGIKGIINVSNLPSSYVYGTGATLVNPVKKGYTFKGWYTDKNYKKSIKSIKSSEKKNYTLYAKWQKVCVGSTDILSLTSTKAKTVRLKLSKVSGVSGYEITFSTNKSFKAHKKVTVTKKTSMVIKKLSSEKTYYVKVRAYKIDSAGNKVYGKYTKTYKIKVK